jgi:outer membrane protein OmpA-like peptidoglycan-associated protein
MQAEAKKDSLLTIIENIYYDYGKWDLLPQAIITLNKVVDVLKKNPDITIELISHTDSRGTDEFNMELSQKRAATAMDYIVAKGINKSRLSAKGMGETQLVNRCKDGVECSEDEHAQNRRTEFKVRKKK